MNYQKHYNSLIARAKDRILKEYSEKHHIVPKCVGGLDKKENLVRLTPEEHFVAHQFLIKIYPDNLKLVYAARMMTINSSNQIRSNKLFGWIRRKNAASRGPQSEKHRENNSKSHRSPRGTYTIEHRKNISIAKKNKPQSEEHKAALRKPKKIIVCPYCNLSGGANNMKRWHFDNCREKK